MQFTFWVSEWGIPVSSSPILPTPISPIPIIPTPISPTKFYIIPISPTVMFLCQLIKLSKTPTQIFLN